MPFGSGGVAVVGAILWGKIREKLRELPHVASHSGAGPACVPPPAVDNGLPAPDGAASRIPIQRYLMKSAAFFDLDKTLLPFSTEKRFVQRLHARKLVGLRQLLGVLLAYLRYQRLDEAGYAAMKRGIVRDLLRGKSQAEIAAVAEQVFREVFASAIHPEARAAIAQHRAEGRAVYLVSATVDAVAGCFAAHLEVDGCHATTLEVMAGRFTGEVVGGVCYGGAKAGIVREIALREGIDLDLSHAYGDSYEDRHMLAAVGYPVAVNPDRRLAAWAGERGWSLARWGR